MKPLRWLSSIFVILSVLYLFILLSIFIDNSDMVYVIAKGIEIK